MIIDQAQSTVDEDDFHENIKLKQIGRMVYQDGQVNIAQNQEKPTDFYATPFPYLLSDKTNCHENPLKISLYTSELIEAVKSYLYKSQSKLCGTSASSFVCHVSIIPIEAIRIFDKSIRANSPNNPYTLENNWRTNDLHSQTIEFSMYLTNMSVCEKIRKALVTNCRLSNFEIQYTINGSKNIQKQPEITTEHVTNTQLYRQIRTQSPSTDIVLLAENDFNELISQSVDAAILHQRTQINFDDAQISSAMNRLLKSQLSKSHV